MVADERPLCDQLWSSFQGSSSIAIQKASKAALESSASPLQDRALSYQRSSCFRGTRAVGARQLFFRVRHGMSFDLPPPDPRWSPGSYEVNTGPLTAYEDDLESWRYVLSNDGRRFTTATWRRLQKRASIQGNIFASSSILMMMMR